MFESMANYLELYNKSIMTQWLWRVMSSLATGDEWSLASL